jgi:hypothetical protein
MIGRSLPAARLADLLDELARLSVRNVVPALTSFNYSTGGIATLQGWWYHLRRQLPRHKWKGFDTLFALTA